MHEESLGLQIWYIALPEMGRVFPNERNLKNNRLIICRNCRRDIKRGDGYEFRQRDTKTGLGNGYLCGPCVISALRATEIWQFNPSELILGPGNRYSKHKFEGERLAKWFIQEGLGGLLIGIRAALEVPKNSVIIHQR